MYRNTIMADSSDPTVPTIPTILPSRSMRESKHARSPRWDMSRRLKAILARLNFRHNYLCSVLFPSLSTLSFSVSKSHPKGSPCLTMRLTIKPLSRYTSTSPLPFSFGSHRLFSRPGPGPPSPSPCNARHSARTVTSSLRVRGHFGGNRK